MVVGYMGDVIRDYFGDGSRFGANISYVTETEPLGTAGALGGKLLGAGGGGFLVFYVPADRRDEVMRAMEGLMYVPFRFENGGTRVIHYTPETYVMRNRETH